MDLKFLIPSKVRRAVLKYFIDNPKAQVGVRELAREIKISPQQTYRELINMENWGFLFSSKRANQRAYRLNGRFPLYLSLQKLLSDIDQANEQTYNINRVFKWKQLSKEYDRIPIPKEMILGLTSKRLQPRAFDEEKIMKKKGLL
ncbi:MAG TPA: hypothetical protein DDW49_10090 [Deltaproteobacteria bacterium]|nr:MAG: hypothetical protein A2048_08570 [Deltaproteobacteria bacterium GWA2_45_12]HBF13712.1 hypothetical protein [Deltaproteobacteria bacterium]